MINITVKVDDTCEMASVNIDGVCVMEGNFWDFHPGCHGIYKYGNFKTYNNLAGMIQAYYNKKNINSEISWEKYKFYDDTY